ncbi:MAG: anthranilate phosphoribosyltransferase, partial [Atopobiaceae bacterium]|nr:anthranilate phosphoribosyltransferase [Atopobiaceae bacterium]
MMIAEAIKKIVDKQDLNYDEAYQVMSEIMDGKTSQVQNAAYLAALSTKSTHAETIDEISGSAAAMRDHALAVDAGPDVLDIVGTGGDNAQTFNISTTSAFVIAADGVRVAKHGNRAASSQCGTADCLEALGATIAVEPADAARMVDEVGMCFLFAQKYHASMRFVGSIRRELGIRTVFNILGPLTNPAHPAYMVLGVYDGALAEPLAKVLTDLGVRRAFVVYGTDCLDEISASAPTMVCEVRDGFYRTIEVTPEQFGLTRCERADLAGGTPDENAAIVRAVLSGEQGPRRTAVLMNAGAALYVAGHADTMAAGIERAAALVGDGSALAKLDEFVAATQ